MSNTKRPTREDFFDKPAYDGDRIMWVEEIKDKTGSAGQTVYKWFSNGTLPCFNLGGRRGCWESDFLATTNPKESK